MLALLAALVTTLSHGQTEVRNASFTFTGGVYPTYSVVFNGTDAGTVEKWFKDQLKPISADMGGKKEVMSIGTRLPEVSSDTMRVFVRASQLKGSKDVTAHVAFRVNNAFIGPDNEERQREGCRSWMYQNSVMLKKNIAQDHLETERKKLAVLEDELAGLVKEKDRAEHSIEKTQRNINDAGIEKIGTEGESKMMETQVESKRQEVATATTEENNKELQDLLKDQEKLRKKTAKLTEDIADGNKKIDDLQFGIKKNLAAQDAKNKAIDAQRKLVEDLTAKLEAIN